MENFGRSAYEKKQEGVDGATNELSLKNETATELKRQLADAVAKESISPQLIIDIAKQLIGSNTDIEEAERILRNKKQSFDTFYGDMQVYAGRENELLDVLADAVKGRDYEKIIEVARHLEEHGNTNADPEGYDAGGTQELFKKFAKEFKYIGGLVEGKAMVQLENGKYAFIDADGKQIPGEYQDAWFYSEGKAKVQLENGKWAFIDADGKQIPLLLRKG